MLLMHGGFALVHCGRSPMKPGFPVGSVPGLACAPEAVAKS